MKEKNIDLSVREITELIEEAIPSSLQEDWDNSGLLLGFGNRKVKKILTCLELDMRVVEEAISKDVDMIVTHHPLIFGGLRSIDDSDPMGEAIIELIKREISVYSSHTPFDKISGGNNDALAGLLGLKNITDLGGGKVRDAGAMLEDPSEMHIGRIGQFKQTMKLSEVVDLCCDVLSINPLSMRVVGDLEADIDKVGICTGAGAEYIGTAKAQGCQLFITGDLNCTDGDAPIDAILTDTRKKFQDARAMVSRPEGPKGTSHGFKTTTPTRRIDWIFVSGNAKASAYRVIDDQLKTQAWESDHLPVMFTFSFIAQ